MDGWARRRLLALVVAQAGDALICAIPIQLVKDDLDRLGVPERFRPVIPTAKALSAVGLATGLRRPRLGALTAAALVLYFLLAIGAHARLRDEAWRYAPAVGMLGWSLHTWRAFRREVG